MYWNFLNERNISYFHIFRIVGPLFYVSLFSSFSMNWMDKEWNNILYLIIIFFLWIYWICGFMWKWVTFVWNLENCIIWLFDWIVFREDLLIKPTLEFLEKIVFCCDVFVCLFVYLFGPKNFNENNEKYISFKILIIEKIWEILMNKSNLILRQNNTFGLLSTFFLFGVN